MTEPIDWDALAKNHPAELVSAVRNLFVAGGAFSTSATDLASDANGAADEADRLLTRLCPPLESLLECYCPQCDGELNADEINFDICPHCCRPYGDNGVRQISTFVYGSPRSRDVSWVLALHGMNTRGAWQEEFNWRMSNAYGRSVPVAIYKYGLVRPGAIWRPSLRRKVRDLVAKMERLQGETAQSGFVGPPDVIAHSLGTWLIGHALLWTPSLRIGRLILTGSVLRPDFDWALVLARGQVQAVLNHYGSRDSWASVAHFAIPDSGPSGRRGFSADADVKQVCAAEFRHSDFFRPENLGIVFDSVWIPFLTRPPNIEIAASSATPAWQPAGWPLRATMIPFLLLVAYWGLIAVLTGACLRGLFDGLRWLLGV